MALVKLSVLSLAVLTFAAVGVRLSYGSKKCDVRILDECSANMAIVGIKDFKIPSQDDKEILEMCSYVKDNVTCIRNYTRHCLDPLRRQLVNMYALGGTRIITTYCDEPENRKVLIQFLPCLNGSIGEFSTCMDRVIKEFEEIGKSPSGKDRIGMMCCRFADYRNCMMDKAQKICGDEAVERAKTLVTTIVGDFMDIACVGYEPDAPSCIQFPRPEVEGREPGSLSVVPPVLKILEDFL